MHNWLAYVIYKGSDIDDVQAALGVEIIEGWTIYDSAAKTEPISEDACIAKQFRAFAAPLTAFPKGSEFSQAARDAMLNCARDFADRSPDDKLMDLIRKSITCSN